jgi:hypothetical protein
MNLVRKTEIFTKHHALELHGEEIPLRTPNSLLFKEACRNIQKTQHME